MGFLGIRASGIYTGKETKSERTAASPTDQLSEGAKTFIASSRVKIEHTIASVKRLKNHPQSNKGAWIAGTRQNDEYCLRITQPEIPTMGGIKKQL